LIFIACAWKFDDFHLILQKIKKYFMNFREKIKALCKENNITQKELSKKLGISDISLNQTLRGKYPQLQTLEKIATALNISISELFEPIEKNYITCPKCGEKLVLQHSPSP
jgi:transcriptional regulator with XRE-family HTH domain